MARFNSLNKIWRSWLRIQSPRRWVVPWTKPYKASLLILCILVAATSSWHLLLQPNIRPGIPAPFDSIAPKNALVEDSKALQQRTSDLIQSTFVQVIDQKESTQLKNRLKRQLDELELVATSNDAERIGPVNLNKNEQLWLSTRSPETRSNWEKEINLAAEKMLSQGLIKTLALDQFKESASLQLLKLGSKENPSRSLGSKVIANTLHGNSNVRMDPVRSQKLIEELITQQGIPTIKVNRGDLITKKGEPISSQAFDVLDHFGLISRTPKPIEWFKSFSEALGSCAILLLIMRKEKPCLQARHGALALCLLLITQISKLWLGSAVSPLTVIVPPTLLISQGLGSTSALVWMAISSLIWPVPINEIGEGRILVTSFVAALVAFQGGRMRSRAQLLQMAVLLPFGALIGEWLLLRNEITPANGVWGRLAPNSEELISEALVLGAMLMLTILLIPILESTFGLITKARLMELADHERPLLRRLSSEAPGTFEHTLMICGLAEEGARTIGADIDLIRTGALYHDVGKLHAPEWFIENQTDGNNPHDQVNDPYKSADVLQAHVDEGLKLAKKHRLPRPISDFIPEHQGTLKMGYFLHKAREKNQSVAETRFRYKGPIPRSRETAILMLADGCEAALRSMNTTASDEEACTTVRKIVESRQRDGQLKESSLTRAEVELLIRAFVRVWRRMRHRRIAYPVGSVKKSYPA